MPQPIRPIGDPAGRLWLPGIEGPAERGEARRVHGAGAGPLTGEELQTNLGLHPRATYDFLDALVALGLLQRSGNGPAAKYANTAGDGPVPRQGEADLHRRHARDAQRPAVPVLERSRHRPPDRQAAERGQAAARSRCSRCSTATRRGSSSSCCAMRGHLGAELRGLRREVRLLALQDAVRRGRRHRSAGDRRWRAAPAHGVPVVRPARRRADRRKRIAQRRHVRRVSTAVAGDFFKDPLPKADVITMGMILHDWNLEKKMQLIRAAYDALPPGGAFVAIETPDRRRAARERVRPDDVAEHADRVRRRVRLHVRGLQGLVPGAGFKRFELLHLAGPAAPRSRTSSPAASPPMSSPDRHRRGALDPARDRPRRRAGRPLPRARPRRSMRRCAPAPRCSRTSPTPCRSERFPSAADLGHNPAAHDPEDQPHARHPPDPRRSRTPSTPPSRGAGCRRRPREILALDETRRGRIAAAEAALAERNAASQRGRRRQGERRRGRVRAAARARRRQEGRDRPARGRGGAGRRGACATC